MKIINNSAIVNISMPPALLVELDGWAKLSNYSRSGFIREAIKYYIVSVKKEKKVRG